MWGDLWVGGVPPLKAASASDIISTDPISFELHACAVIGRALWSDPVCRGCDQSRRTRLRRNEVVWGEVRWGEMSDIWTVLRRSAAAAAAGVVLMKRFLCSSASCRTVGHVCHTQCKWPLVFDVHIVLPSPMHCTMHALCTVYLLRT